MKWSRLVYIFVLLACLVTLGFSGSGDNPIRGTALTDRLPGVDGKSPYISGEHLPVIASGSVIMPPNGGDIATIWHQTGWSFQADSTKVGQQSNRNISYYNPQVFTLLVDLQAVNDSIGLLQAWFMTAIDTNDSPIWNPDTTNLFVYDGAYNNSNYGSWVFEDIPRTIGTTDTIIRAYPIRVFHGGWIRFYFDNILTAMGDSVQVDYWLIGEH